MRIEQKYKFFICFFWNCYIFAGKLILMELFFKTIFEGIKQGSIAAWHDMKWYICGAAILLVLYLSYTFVRQLIDKIRNR